MGGTVETGTGAARVVQLPNEYGSGGVYSLSGVSGTMAAGLAGNSPIFSFRNGHATKFVVVQRIALCAGNTSTAFAAGVLTFNLWRCTAFSASDTGGTAILPAAGNAMRTGPMARSIMTAANNCDIRVSSTGTLTAGTRTKDAVQLGAIVNSTTATAGNQLLPPDTALFECTPGEYPLVLAQNEGFVIEATVPATGTWVFAAHVDWWETNKYATNEPAT